MAMPSQAAASSPSTATCAWPPTWPASGCRSRASASSSPSGSGRSAWKSLGPPTRGTCSSPASLSTPGARRRSAWSTRSCPRESWRRQRRSSPRASRGTRPWPCPASRRRFSAPSRSATPSPTPISTRPPRALARALTRARAVAPCWRSAGPCSGESEGDKLPARPPLLEDVRARPPRVEDGGAPLRVVGAVPEGDGLEAAGFVEATRAGVGLEGIETDRRRQLRERPLQQDGADALADPLRDQVELLDPAPVGLARHGEQSHDLTPHKGHRGPSRGNQAPANPRADLLVGVGERRARDELATRSQVDRGEGLSVARHGRPAFQRSGRMSPHYARSSLCRIRPASATST